MLAIGLKFCDVFEDAIASKPAPTGSDLCLSRNSPLLNWLCFPSARILIFAPPNSTCQARRF
ncbi:hypothetical protein EMIT0P44_40193 [Pseudomonas sp. IT-P44]